MVVKDSVGQTIALNTPFRKHVRNNHPPDPYPMPLFLNQQSCMNPVEKLPYILEYKPGFLLPWRPGVKTKQEFNQDQRL